MNAVSSLQFPSNHSSVENYQLPERCHPLDLLDPLPVESYCRMVDCLKDEGVTSQGLQKHHVLRALQGFQEAS